MLALFHDKKCCNCFNFIHCILWDFIVLGLVLSWWRLKLNWRLVHFATTSWESLTLKILAKLTAWHDSSASNHVLLTCPFRRNRSRELQMHWSSFHARFLPFKFLHFISLNLFSALYYCCFFTFPITKVAIK